MAVVSVYNNYNNIWYFDTKIKKLSSDITGQYFVFPMARSFITNKTVQFAMKIEEAAFVARNRKTPKSNEINVNRWTRRSQERTKTRSRERSDLPLECAHSRELRKRNLQRARIAEAWIRLIKRRDYRKMPSAKGKEVPPIRIGTRLDATKGRRRAIRGEVRLEEVEE